MNRNAYHFPKAIDPKEEARAAQHLSEVSTTVDNSKPQEFSHLTSRAKQKSDKAHQQAVIDRENAKMAARINATRNHRDWDASNHHDFGKSIAQGRANHRKAEQKRHAAEIARMQRVKKENPRRMSTGLGRSFAKTEQQKQRDLLAQISKFPVQSHHEKPMSNKQRAEALGRGRLATHTNDPFSPDLYLDDGYQFDTSMPDDGIPFGVERPRSSGGSRPGSAASGSNSRPGSRSSAGRPKSSSAKSRPKSAPKKSGGKNGRPKPAPRKKKAAPTIESTTNDDTVLDTISENGDVQDDRASSGRPSSAVSRTSQVSRVSDMTPVVARNKMVPASPAQSLSKERSSIDGDAIQRALDAVSNAGEFDLGDSDDEGERESSAAKGSDGAQYPWESVPDLWKDADKANFDKGALEKAFPTAKASGAARDEAWSELDFNGNGYVSLAEFDKWFNERTIRTEGAGGATVEGTKSELFRYGRPALIRAFNLANGVAKANPDKGGLEASADDYVTKPEFRLLLVSLQAALAIFRLFDIADTSDDRRVSKEEWTAQLAVINGELRHYGYTGRALNGDDFDSVDADGGGVILLDEAVHFFLGVFTKEKHLLDQSAREARDGSTGKKKAGKAKGGNAKSSAKQSAAAKKRPAGSARPKRGGAKAGAKKK